MVWRREVNQMAQTNLVRSSYSARCRCTEWRFGVFVENTLSISVCMFPHVLEA